MHRQPKGQKLVRTTVHLDAGLLAVLDAAASDQGLSRSAALAQVVRAALSKHKEARA